MRSLPTLMIVFGGALALAVALVGCTSTNECSLELLERGNDGLYPGYRDCSAARYPDFTDPTTRWDGTYPERCIGTEGEHAFACAEQLYWQVFQFDHAARPDAYDALLALTERVEAERSVDDERLAILYVRLGVLGTALAIEQGDFSRAQNLLAHLQTAHEYQPDNAFIESWLLTIEIGQNVFLEGDWEAGLRRLEELYEAEPQIVAGAFATVGAARSLDSGWPQKAAEIADGLEALGCGQFCGWDAHRAPYAGPGGYFTYAEVLARVGNRERARFWLEQALAHERADDWPLRPLAEASLGDLDTFVGKFAERGSDEAVDDLFVTSNENSCGICHAPRPAF